jgi:hypothetical protein
VNTFPNFLACSATWVYFNKLTEIWKDFRICSLGQTKFRGSISVWFEFFIGEHFFEILSLFCHRWFQNFLFSELLWSRKNKFLQKKFQLEKSIWQILFFLGEHFSEILSLYCRRGFCPFSKLFILRITLVEKK